MVQIASKTLLSESCRVVAKVIFALKIAELLMLTQCQGHNQVNEVCHFEYCGVH